MRFVKHYLFFNIIGFGEYWESIFSVRLFAIRFNHPAGQPFPGVARRLAAVVIRILVDNYRMSNCLGDCKTIGEESKERFAVIGKKHRKIPGVIAMGLVVGIPMFARALKRIGRVADPAIVELMDVETMGPDWGTVSPGRLIGR